jgi:hypothetical protein
MTARPIHSRFYATAWRKSTLAMPLEVEGLLIRISAFNMESGVPLPKCRTTTCRMIGLHRNKLDKLLNVLLASGDLVDDERGIYSARAISEFEASNMAIASKATTKQPHGNPPPNPIATTPLTPPVEAEKSEQILRAIVEKEKEKERIERKVEKSSVPLSQNPEPKAVDGRTEDSPSDYLKEVFAGQTEAMLVFTETAMGGFCRPNAVQWLSTTVAAHGSDAVAQAFASMIEKRAAGEIITRPLPLWSNIAAGIKRGYRNANAAAKRQSIESPPKPKGVGEILRERAVAVAAAAAAKSTVAEVI